MPFRAVRRGHLRQGVRGLQQTDGHKNVAQLRVSVLQRRGVRRFGHRRVARAARLQLQSKRVPATPTYHHNGDRRPIAMTRPPPLPVPVTIPNVPTNPPHARRHCFYISVLCVFFFSSVSTVNTIVTNTV